MLACIRLVGPLRAVTCLRRVPSSSGGTMVDPSSQAGEHRGMRRFGLAMGVVTVTLALHGCSVDAPHPGAVDLSFGRVDLASTAATPDLTGGCTVGTECSGRCVDLAADRSHCGACGFACPLNVACVGGRCMGCLPGFMNCFGVCVHLLIDPRNCGACGRVCKGGMICSEGVCL